MNLLYFSTMDKIFDSVKTYIWIASHLNCTERLKTLKVALKSAANQTIKSHVYVSFSVDNNILKIIDIQHYISELEKLLINVNHTILYQKTRKQQFEHLKIIYDTIDKFDGETWVAFLDDDDLIDPKRIEDFLICKAENPDKSVFMSGDMVFPYYGSEIRNIEIARTYYKDKVLPDTEEFANFIVRMNVLSKFFNEYREYYKQKLVSGIMDTVFVDWLRKKFRTVYIPGVHYIRIVGGCEKCWADVPLVAPSYPNL